MKHSLLSVFILSLLGIFSVHAQSSNVILFTENGEKFHVVLNGILQNSNPETNVKVTELTAPAYKCRVVFADDKLGFLDFTINLPHGSEELTMSIKQNKKGEYVKRHVSSIPIAQSPQAPAGQVQIVYRTVAPVVSSVSTTVSQTTTTHSSGSNTSGDNINLQMGVSVSDEGGNISIVAGGTDGQDGSIISHSSTTTTTTTLTTTSSTDIPATKPPSPSYISGYSGPIGCPIPMLQEDFASLKQNISANDFEATRLSIAKQALQNNCFLAGQVKEVLALFEFENTKLEFAKFAYDHTYDPGNYFKVNEVFDFESSIEELNTFISAQ